MIVILAQAEKIVDAAMMYRSDRWWFLTGTRDKCIDAIMAAKSNEDAADRLEQALSDGQCDFSGNDPHDECRSDKWFYYHPAMAI